MATIGQLVTVIAVIEGLDEGSVKLVARYAREAGYIGQHLRGAGAAKMTAGDAANLLIAVNGGVLAKDAAKTIERYRELILERDHARDPDDRLDDRDDSDPIDLALRKGNNFGYALEAILDACIVRDNRTGIEPPYEVEVTFVRPNIMAKIRIGHWPNHEEETPEVIAACDFVRIGPDKQLGIVGRIDETTITDATIRAVANVIAR